MPMLGQRSHTFKHLVAAGVLVLACLAGRPAGAGETTVDLLACGTACWRPASQDWAIDGNSINGTTRVLDGAKTDPEASVFLVSRQKFGGDLVVTMEASFAAGRYLGVYLDFDQATQTGIWMATGHALAADAPRNEIERAYIKTVEDSFWIVRATGELAIAPAVPVRLRFVRERDTYSIWQDDVLVVTYRKVGGYPPGPLQLRLTNASARIDLLEVSYARDAT